MSFESFIQTILGFVLLFTIGLWVGFPILVTIIGSLRRSRGIASFISLILLFPLNIAIKKVVRPSGAISVSLVSSTTEAYKFQLHTFTNFQFKIDQSDLVQLCEEYMEYNEFPIEEEDYPYFENYQFYNGVSMTMSRCDHCNSAGTHLLVGYAFGHVPIQIVICSDCFDKVTHTISSHIEDNPEFVMSTQI